MSCLDDSTHSRREGRSCYPVDTCFLLRVMRIVALWGVLLLLACDPDTKREIEAAMSRAAGTVSDLSASEETALVNGEPDYGVKVKFTLLNVSEAGLITITTRLSTSEGEWSRSQKLSFSAGESKLLTYFFHEPTINATNIQYSVTVSPQPKK